MIRHLRKKLTQVQVKIFFNLDDIIVNPAETNGKTLVLASLGFDLSTAEAKKTMEEKSNHC